MDKSFLRLVGALALTLVISLPAAASAWPTTRFIVFPGNPVANVEVLPAGENWQDYEFEDPDIAPNVEAIALVEASLGQAAEWFDKRGFPAPALELVEDEFGKAYRVYLCEARDADFSVEALMALGPSAALEQAWGPCGSVGAYVTECRNESFRNQYFYLNYNQVLAADNRLTELGYQTLAHELVHAIVPKTAAGASDTGCESGRWIREGLADALGWAVTDAKFAGDYAPERSSNAVVKRAGFRPYDEPLFDGSKEMPVVASEGFNVDAGYSSSSFWRYLSEASGEGWSFLVAGADGPPLGVLDVPFDTTMEPGWKRDVIWLNAGLRGQFNLTLGQLYGLFTSHFANQIPPMATYDRPPSSDDHEHWLSLLFGGCHEVELTADQPWKVVNVELDRLASDCIWVAPTGSPGKVEITFQAMETSYNELMDLQIGRPGTTLLARPIPPGRVPLTDATYATMWRDFPQDGSQRTLYIVSNAARAPEETRPRQTRLVVALPGHDNSFLSPTAVQPAPVAPTPGQPGPAKPAKPLQQQRSETSDMVARQIELDKTSLNAGVSRSAEVARYVRVAGCVEPFVYDACGPQLSINLNLVPGSYGALGMTTGDGGLAAQAFGGLMSMARTSMVDAGPVMQEIEAKLDQIDGHRVSISIPLIDYGFRGDFDNAAISVDMSGDRIWRAISHPDAVGRTRLTGSVTIEEYSPFMVRGRFTAPLAEFVENPSGGPALYQRRDTIRGRFNSLAPWLVDARVEVVQTASHEEIAEDIANALGLSPKTVQTLRDQGVIPQGNALPNASGGNSGGGAIQTPVECTCECAIKSVADDLCQLLCEEEFAACP